MPFKPEPQVIYKLRSAYLCRWRKVQSVFHFSLSCIGEGNGNPLQCSCLENPRDSVQPAEHQGAWWAAISGVAQSQTRLKWLSSSSSSSGSWCSSDWSLWSAGVRCASSLSFFLCIKTCALWESPSSPVMRTPYFHHRGMGSISGWGTKVPQSAWRGQILKSRSVVSDSLRPHGLYTVRRIL